MNATCAGPTTQATRLRHGRDRRAPVAGRHLHAHLHRHDGHRRVRTTRQAGPGACRDQHPLPRRQLLQLQQHRPERLRELQRGVPAVQLVRHRDRQHPLQDYRRARDLRRRRPGRRFESLRSDQPAPAAPRQPRQVLANTYEKIPLPADLSVPGAVVLRANADCFGRQASPTGRRRATRSTQNSTGRIDPPFWFGSYGWQGYIGQGNFLEFGKKPFAPVKPARSMATSSMPRPGRSTTRSCCCS